MLPGPFRLAHVYVLETETRKNGQGLVFGIFLTGIFLPRFLIEFVKNNQEAFEENMLLNMGQLLSIPFIIAGIWLIVRAIKRPRTAISFATPGKK